MPDPQQPIDYKSAGVDIEAGNEAVRRMKAHVARTHSPAVLTGLGSFGSLFSLTDAIKGMADPVMVQSTDGVGTKTLVAVMAGRYENLGRDLVAAVAGDIAVMGARPLTFLDYLGLHKVEPAIVEELVRGMSAACEESGIALVGGETAEMPSVYAPGDLDVVGFVTGVVDRSKLLTGANIVAGDVLYGVSSSGLHTNGWSLARKLLFEINKFDIHEPRPELNGATLADVLLEPHANYVTTDPPRPRRRHSDQRHGAHHGRRPHRKHAAHSSRRSRRRHRPHDLETAAHLHVVAEARPDRGRRDASRLQHGHWACRRRAAPAISPSLADAFAPILRRRDRPCGGQHHRRALHRRSLVTMLSRQELLDAIPHCLTQTNLPLPNKYPGKVRDTYDLGDRLLLITTDRQSGFDRMLGAIPYKGQVLNRTSLHWFEATRHIVAQPRDPLAARERAARAQVPRAAH